uniref:Uncharacterized protein n=1 Tax=Arundo donax TaxID=35708 RepID=A0A0A9HIH3_ARUDO
MIPETDASFNFGFFSYIKGASFESQSLRKTLLL